jgi:Bacterial PH domain
VAAEARFILKRDRRLVLVVWPLAVVLVVAGLLQIASPAAPALRVIILVGCLTGAACLVWVLYGTMYTFAGDTLRVRNGPFRVTVPLADIDSVTPSSNHFSNPAGSLDRLHIRYHHSDRSLLVTPGDKLGFLRVILERCPHLRLTGDRVVRVRASGPR